MERRAPRSRLPSRVRGYRGIGEGNMGDAHMVVRDRAGFTLVELMIVVAIIAIVASLAVPRMVSARAASHETAAISALRSLSSAQAQLQSSNAIDTNANGAGEFGSLGELAGAQPLRVSVGGAPAPGVAGVDELIPAPLPPVFGRIDANGVVMHKGYVYRVFLPGAGNAPVGIPEAGGGGFPGGPFPDPTNGQILWCAYSWPSDAGITGRRAFFVNEDGEILASSNRGTNGAPIYSGVGAAGQPLQSAAYVGGHMASGSAANAVGTDGNRWLQVQ
jgi:prepilin-type N-terminal cleavage/methylation domain-containing protein